MPIYFNSAVNREPFQFDSLGIHWEQEPTRRPKGFPLYHYLQTEKGAGLVRALPNAGIRGGGQPEADSLEAEPEAGAVQP